MPGSEVLTMARCLHKPIYPGGSDRIEKSMSTANQSGLRILVVDDEINIRKTLSTFLETEGHQVVAVSDPIDALAESGRTHFDMAFIDLHSRTPPASI